MTLDQTEIEDILNLANDVVGRFLDRDNDPYKSATLMLSMMNIQVNTILIEQLIRIADCLEISAETSIPGYRRR